MYMVGGSPGRVHRGNKPYPGAKRFMQPSKVKRPFDWRLAGEMVMAVLYFGGLIFALQVIALYFR